MLVKIQASLKWDSVVCLLAPSLPAAGLDRLPHPVWAASLWPPVLTVCNEREGERERELRDGEREGGKDGWWTRGRPCGHHHQAAPDSSYHAWAALWRAAVGRWGGLRMRNSRGEKRARSAELIVLWRGTLTTGVITVEQAMGHCSSPRRPTDSYATAASCRPHCRVLPRITGCCGSYCNHSSNIWRQ